MSSVPLPPKTITQALHVARYTLPSGQIVSRYENADGTDAGLPWIYHLAAKGLDPPPSPSPPP